MKIASIAVTHHRIPLDPPFHPTWDSRPRREFVAVLVRVESDSGHVGYGSGDAMPGFAGHEELFLGQDPLALERHYAVIQNLSFHLGKHWPLDIALWDLAGQIQGQPIWQLLGGAGAPLPAYASLGERRDRTATADAAQAARAQGFQAIKLRFFRDDWRQEVKIAEAARAAVGPDIKLMIDCNQAWRMQWDIAPSRGYDEALALLRALQPLDIHWVEEPLFRGDYQGLRRLREASGMRIAGGELTREVHEAAHMVELGCFDVLQTDVALAGGITGLRPLAHLCKARGVTFTPHTWGNGLMIAAACQLTAGTVGAPFLEFPWDPPTWTTARRDFFLREPIEIDAAGCFVMPPGPGLGIELDHERLAATRIA